MRISVIGAGLAGLSVSWHLLQFPGVELTVYDEGKSASLASTGLLYPFPGRMAARCWLAKEGMEASIELLSVAENALSLPCASRSGILRLPWADWQKKALIKRTQKDPDAVWIEDGMWIESGITVFSKRYIAGLKKACIEKGATFIQARVDDLSSLQSDQIVLATGSETNDFTDLPLAPVKGQALLCRWDSNRLPYSLVANGHITLTEDPELCLIGSSYESVFSSPDPDSKIIPELIEKAALFYPAAKEFTVVEVLAGVRMASTVSYRPLAEKIGENLWAFTALGSRGLLYHALLGKRLAQDLVLSCR